MHVDDIVLQNSFKECILRFLAVREIPCNHGIGAADFLDSVSILRYLT